MTTFLTRQRALPQASQLLHRPISEDGFAVDVAIVHGAEVAAVVRHRAMVAEDEEAVRRNHNFTIRARVGVIAGDVVFVERLAVHVDLAILDANPVAGNSDDALDVALRSVAWIAEDDEVAALDGLPAIDKLVDEDPLLVFEAGHHAGAFNLHRLVEKDNNEGGDGERDQQIARPDRHHGQRAPTRFFWNRRYRRLRARHIRHRVSILSDLLLLP